MTIKNDAYKVYESKTSAIFISQQNEIKSNFICLKQREILRYLRDEYDLMIIQEQHNYLVGLNPIIIAVQMALD